MWLEKDDLVREMVVAKPDLVHMRGPGNTTPLCYAGPELAEFLIDHGADILAPIEPDEERANSLYVARNPIQVHARWPSISTLRVLLKRSGIDLDVYLAVVMDAGEQVNQMVQQDTTLVSAMTDEAHVLGGGLLLLHLAVRYNRGELVKFLLDQGADSHARAPGYKNLTPLHIAAWRDHVELAQFLIDRGADVAAKAGPGNLTPWRLLNKPTAMGLNVQR